MRPKSALVQLYAVLLAVVFCTTSRSSGEATAPTSPPATGKTAAEQFTPDGKEAVAAALERLRRTGSFNHPDYPLVVRARRVHGDTLDFVEFLVRREDGKGFDWVGKAVQVTLTFSEEVKPLQLPWEVAEIPKRRAKLRVRVCQMEMETESGFSFWAEERTLDLPLPARLRESGFCPFAEAEARLSPDQRTTLSKEYSLRPEEKMLLAAFGEEATDLFRVRNLARSESGQTVLAFDQAVRLDSGRRGKFAKLAVARFDRTGKLLHCFRGQDIIAEAREILRLLSGDDSQGLTLKGSDGLMFILPGTKRAQ